MKLIPPIVFMVGAGDPVSINAFLTLRRIRAPTIAILERILIVNIFNNIGRLSIVIKKVARFAVLNTDKDQGTIANKQRKNSHTTAI